MTKLSILLGLLSVSCPAAEYGLASWYGGPFDGRVAASGEVYREGQFTGAHRILPFGTRVLVTRSDADRRVVVRINDRGPFVESRIIDLSQAAARELGMVKPGVVPVSLEVVDVGPAASPALFAVQVGSFRIENNAQRTRRVMELRFGTAKVVHNAQDGELWRVLVGETAIEADASALAAQVRKDPAYHTALVVRMGESSTP